MSVGGEEVPATTYEEGTVEWVRQGEINVDCHFGGEETSLDGREFLIVDVPGNGGWVRK